MSCLSGGYNLHRFSDALGLVYIVQSTIFWRMFSYKKKKKIIITAELYLNLVRDVSKTCASLNIYCFVFFNSKT